MQTLDQDLSKQGTNIWKQSPELFMPRGAIGRVDPDEVPDRAWQHRLCKALWRRMAAELASPIHIIIEKHRRTVTFLGVMRYVIDSRTREVKTYIVVFNGGALKRQRIRFEPKGPLEVGMPLCTLAWVTWYVERCRPLLDRLFRHYGWVWHYCSADYVWKWLARNLSRAIRECVELEEMRRQLRDALCLDPEVVRLALLGRSNAKQRMLHDRDYTSAWQHLEEYRAVAKDAPHLLWLYITALKCDVGLAPGEIVAALKNAMHDCGVHERGWKLLANHRRRDFRGVLEKWPADFLDVALLIRIHEALGYGRPLSSATQEIFWRSLVRDDLDHPDRVSRLCRQYAPVFRALAAEVARGADIPGELMQQEFHMVLQWLRGAKPVIDRNQARAGWRYFVRRGREWKQELERHRQKNSVAWFTPVPALQFGEVEAVPIKDSYWLWKEGEAMRNCAADYAEACAANEARFFSLREVKTGNRLATAKISRNEERWSLDDVRGPANTEASADLHSIASRVAENYTNAMARRVPEDVCSVETG